MTLYYCCLSTCHTLSLPVPCYQRLHVGCLCFKMATERDLSNAVRDSLQTNGNLGRIRAEIRTEVMKLLNVSNRINMSKRPCQPHNILLLNELIREYFNWIGYKFTCSVLTTECELSKQPFDQDFLMQSLGIKEYEKSNDLPLLLQMLEICKDVKNA